MAKLIDEETRRILVESEEQCEFLITKYRKGLDLIARALLEHESISGDEVYRLLNLSGAELELPGNTSLADAVAPQDRDGDTPGKERDSRVEAVLDSVKQRDSFAE